MARYLNEREVAFDAGTIGFPNIGDCMGVVLQTQNGLYGFHATAKDSGDRVNAFAQFVENSVASGKRVHLYGSCIREKRYDGKKSEWQTEMNQLAGALKYRGPVSGFDLPFYGGNDATYVEYCADLLSGTCKIFYKRMSKMDLGSGANPGTDPVKRVNPAKGGGFELGNPVSKVTVSATIVKTYWNNGEMHQAATNKVDTFAVA